jgi:secreted trypsin-like serine protease
VEWQEAFPKLAAELAAELDNGRRPARIWGGRDANPTEIPYQAGIVVSVSSGPAFCGGSIISNSFVLSAADCFPGNPNAVIEAGHIDRQANPELISAAEIIVHPEFEDSNDNNIALVRLVREFAFTANLRAVRLPNRRQVSATFESQQARFSGWGAQSLLGANPTRFLRIGFSPVLSQTTCRLRFPASSSARTLCIDGSNANFCNGDFGGPVTVQDADGITTLIGVSSMVSVVTRCTGGGPGILTRTSAYLDWIEFNSDVVILN